MSVPRNHHYVSQVLSEKFMSTEGKLYKYNKHHKYNKFHTKTSTKSLFSQKDLNSKKDDAGNIDHNSVELELNKNFETDFNKHYKVIIDVVNTDRQIGERIPNSDEVIKSVKYLIGMALIAQVRHPIHIQNTNSTIFGVLFEIAKNATDELKNEIYSSYQHVEDITNKIPVDYKELSEGIAQTMGEVIYSLQIAPENEFFILPDCSAVQRRVGLEPDIIDGEKYYNLSKPIATVLMPINSKILLAVTAERLIPEELKENQHGIYPIKKELVMNFNRILFNEAFSEVICENQKYLSDLVYNLEKLPPPHLDI
jgi:hypothetical protein